MKFRRDFPGMFDVAKGILMLMVILGHQKGFFQTFLLIDNLFISSMSFGEHYDVVIMGLFFIMAGYSTHIEKDMKLYIKKNSKAILIPYFLTMVVLIVLRAIRYFCSGEFTIQIISPIALGFLYGNGIAGSKLFGTLTMESVGAAWFLLALFWSGFIHQLLLRINHSKVRVILAGSLTIAAVLFPDAHQFQVPWCIVPGCTAVGFREIGRLMKTHKMLYKKINWPFTGMAISLTIILHFISNAKFWSNVWQFGILDYLSAAAAGVVLLQLYIKSELAVARFTDGLAYIGRYSLYFFCLHNVEMLLFPWYKVYTHIFIPLHISWEMAFLIMYVGRIVFAVFGCYLIIWVSGKLKKEVK